MNDINIEIFKRQISTYLSQEDIDKVMKAYHDAEELHRGTFRKSGEPYIIHPLNVAYSLSKRYADMETLCAGILHDTIEDTPLTKEDIAKQYGLEVAKLVDGVSKIGRMEFSTKQEQNVANIRKIVTGLEVDVRIIAIKIADRLHNMRTLQYMKHEKQIENSQETLDIFAPLADYLGDNESQVELRDLALKYLEPDEYNRAKEVRQKIEEESKQCLYQMYDTIHKLLNEALIPNEIKIRIKSIYGISRALKEEATLSKMNDLLALKVVVDDIANCYQSLGVIHRKYHPLNDKFKDYICRPKTNLYQSLHTTVFGEEGKYVQAQIRTPKMHKIAARGLSSFWEMYGKDAKYLMQEELEKKSQFYSYLIDIDEFAENNRDFVERLRQEIFATRIHVYAQTGDVIELPKGATLIDFAYKLDSDNANYIVTTAVNGENVPISYILQNQDRVQLVTDRSSQGPKIEWLEAAKTTHAKRKILDFKTQKF